MTYSVFQNIDSSLVSRSLKNVFGAFDTRQKQVKKCNLCLINEQCEPVFNAATATQIALQRLVRTVSIFPAVLIVVLVTACSSIPQQQQNSVFGPKNSVAVAQTNNSKKINSGISRGGYYLDDGPGENPPGDLHLIPDAIPKHEPLRTANMQPYVAMGKQFKPMTRLKPYKQRGVASWYGRRYHGNNTASGEIYDMYAMTAAHPTLPLPSYARVTNLENGKSVVVRLNDRGPFLSDRLIDLSYTAAYKLGIIANGSGRVEVESILPGSTANEWPRAVSQSTKPESLAPSIENTELKSIYLQLGAFGSSDNAQNFLMQAQQKLPSLKNTISISKSKGLYKIQAGPYPSQIVARMNVDSISRELGIKPLLITD